MKKALVILLAIIILAGIIVTATMGLNVGMEYSAKQKIELYLNKEFNNSDIENIAKEILGNQDIVVQKVEVYEDTVAIMAKEITEEQKTNLVTKINEKYSTEIKNEEVPILWISNVKLIDIIKPYILPVLISAGIILVYMAIRYRKQGVMKVILKTIASIILTQALLVSIFAITRLPVTNIIIVLGLITYIITLLGITISLEKRLERQKQIEMIEKK